jgi:carboxypeptidase PM20D1
MRKLVALPLLLAAGLAVLAGAVALKTALTPSRQFAVERVTPPALDIAAPAGRLGRAVQLRTVSSATDPEANADQFRALHALLQQSFPKAHAALEREVIGHALLYRWKGSDPAAPPFALLAHQDVVPVAPGTEGDWKQPPFSGTLADGFVWGRGAWDDKGMLMAMMEAAESLAADGFTPRRTVYFAFGADEEVGGARGAAEIARRLKERNVRLQFVLDEGLLITEGMIAGLTKPAALIGVAEKGYLTVKLAASATPGHSSMPPTAPEQSAIGILAAALARLDAAPLPGGVRGLPREMFETLAPEMEGLNRVLLSNLWLFKPLVERELLKSASTAAMLRTTTALTVVQAGNKDNVLPGRAEALVNFRLLPGDSSDAVVERVAQTVNNAAVKIERDAHPSEASRVSARQGPGYELIARTLRQLHADVVVAPGLMLGATDSRHFEAIADDVYRFSPMRASPADLKRFHGTDERISTANYAELIQFYRQLLRNAAAPPQ